MEVVLVAVVLVGLVGIGILLLKQTRVLGQVHVLVNSRLTEALDDIAALKKALLEERRHSEIAALGRTSRKKGKP